MSFLETLSAALSRRRHGGDAAPALSPKDRGYQTDLEAVRALAEEEPTRVAQVLHRWIHDENHSR